MLALTSLYTRVSRVSSTTGASHTNPEEQEDPIREHKPVGRVEEEEPPTSFRPAVLISLSKVAHSSTVAPAMPGRNYDHSHTSLDLSGYVPLYSIGWSGCPPNVTILV